MPKLLDGRRTAGPPLLDTVLPAVSRSAWDARQAVRAALRGHVHPDTLDIVALLTTELVSNAVACAPTPLDLRLALSRQGVVHVEVADRNTAVPEPVEASPKAESGRGLLLVGALADAWGASPVFPHGKVVWFALRT